MRSVPLVSSGSAQRRPACTPVGAAAIRSARSARSLARPAARGDDGGERLRDALGRQFAEQRVHRQPGAAPRRQHRQAQIGRRVGQRRELHQRADQRAAERDRRCRARRRRRQQAVEQAQRIGGGLHAQRGERDGRERRAEQHQIGHRGAPTGWQARRAAWPAPASATTVMSLLTPASASSTRPRRAACSSVPVAAAAARAAVGARCQADEPLAGLGRGQREHARVEPGRYSNRCGDPPARRADRCAERHMHGDGGRAAEQIIEAQRLGQLAGRHADALQRDARGRGRRRADAPVAASQRCASASSAMPTCRPSTSARTSAATSASARSAAVRRRSGMGWPGAPVAQRGVAGREHGLQPRGGNHTATLGRPSASAKRYGSSGRPLPSITPRARRAAEQIGHQRERARAELAHRRRGSHSRSATSGDTTSSPRRRRAPGATADGPAERMHQIADHAADQRAG